ncbi:hypothetical protein RRG08_054257 [Elysia crispata]|uniref:DUF6451 domain-containing protein n=1 Tax=Elysia crispata TaxID=231223 RepID=A0AAE1CVX2_9GAST|nr:hypothetical protein RRG08_054257 [Elysia crispata]
MQDKTSTANQLSGSIGLRINPAKSKMLKIKTEDTQAITVGGKPLEVVENFTYLGSVIDHSGGTAADVRSRVAKARAAFKTLDKIWRDRTISTKTKIRLFNSNVKSALLYGCETWSLNQSSLKKVQTLTTDVFAGSCAYFGQKEFETRSCGTEQDSAQSGRKKHREDGDGWATLSESQETALQDNPCSGSLKANGAGEDHGQHGEEIWKRR